ncbi:hypothetical protein IQ07DRAFT_631846 [Pyrenochaeta sp. DS3sAY3a]|nr:hypothetical protein IQ07DRAFT_631846 [Pyrenochaeta sp. DS3sAY3a]
MASTRFLLNAHFITAVQALALRHTLKLREENHHEDSQKMSIEGIIALVGVGVALLGISLTLGWPRWSRWGCRSRRSLHTQVSTGRSSQHVNYSPYMKAGPIKPGRSGCYFLRYEAIVVYETTS